MTTTTVSRCINVLLHIDKHRTLKSLCLWPHHMYRALLKACVCWWFTSC